MPRLNSSEKSHNCSIRHETYKTKSIFIQRTSKNHDIISLLDPKAIPRDIINIWGTKSNAARFFKEHLPFTKGLFHWVKRKSTCIKRCYTPFYLLILLVQIKIMKRIIIILFLTTSSYALDICNIFLCRANFPGSSSFH